MHRRLARRIEAIEEIRDTLLERLARLPDEELRRTPGPGIWSPLQVVEHLVQAEEYVLLAGKPDEALEIRPRTILNRIWYRLVIAILSSPIPVKTPARGMDPTGETGLEELGSRWRRSHARLRRLLLAAERPGREAIFRHPVAGPLTPEGAIRMLQTHLERHLSQIDRRIETRRGPETPPSPAP